MLEGDFFDLSYENNFFLKGFTDLIENNFYDFCRYEVKLSNLF